MKRIWAVILIVLLLPVCALADVQRDDSGEEVREIQQLLFDTGFLFEEPDGKFGKHTEAAVKEFQQAWGLPVTGVVTEEDHRTMVDCWLSLYNADGTPIEGEPLPDDQLEAQLLSPDIEGVPPIGMEGGAFPDGCVCFIGADGDEHIEFCIRHTMIAESANADRMAGGGPDASVCRQWEEAIGALYDEWIRLCGETERAQVASAQAAFFLWINTQRAAMSLQEGGNVESGLEPVLRSQCVTLCALVQGLQE